MVYTVRALCGLALIASQGACASARPRWVEHVPAGRAHEYTVGLGSDSSRAAARKAAITSAMARLAEGRASRVVVTRNDTVARTEVLDADRAGVTRRTQRYSGTLAVGIEAAPLVAHELRVVDEYSERSRGGVDVWVLMRQPRTDGGRPEPGALSLALRSAVLPGWGQRVKQQPRRGALIIGAIAVAVPSAVVLDALRSDAALRATRARTAPVRTYWRDRANSLGAARVAAAGLGGAVYLYGIADAAARHPHEFFWRGAPGDWRIGATLPLRFPSRRPRRGSPE